MSASPNTRGATSQNLHDLADAIASRLDAPSSGNGRGRDVSTEPRVPAGNGRESGRWTTGDDERVSDPMEEIVVKAKRRGKAVLTDDDIAGILYNETRSLHGPDLHKARVAMASSIMNADEKWG